jgi:hypothetical protein
VDYFAGVLEIAFADRLSFLEPQAGAEFLFGCGWESDDTEAEEGLGPAFSRFLRGRTRYLFERDVGWDSILRELHRKGWRARPVTDCGGCQRGGGSETCGCEGGEAGAGEAGQRGAVEDEGDATIEAVPGHGGSKNAEANAVG